MKTKKPFEDIIIENSSWLLRYIRHLSGNNGYVAEDLLQDTLLKCYLNYHGYTEEGRIKSWLASVAKNTVYSYYRKVSHFEVISLDGDDGLADDLTDNESAEDLFMRKTTVSDILNAMANLSDIQKKIFNYRIYGDISVSETSKKLGISEGTVKSATHYTIKKIQNAVKYSESEIKKKGIIMTCREAYALLFMYAKNTISQDDKKDVEAHLKTCPECTSIASALKALIPQISFVPVNNEKKHYLIEFMVNGDKELLSYLGSSCDMSDKYESLNEILTKTGGKIPDDENWFCYGYDTCFENIGEYDNDGNKVDSEIFIQGNKRVRITGMKKVFPYHWSHEVVTTTNSERFPFAKVTGHPDLYAGYLANGFGGEVHSGIYLAIPADVINLRIMSGTGIIDCGTYKFVYTSAYLAETEDIHLACSFSGLK